MSIPFVCPRCGHAIEVDDRLAGKHGHCKHCGHALTVPGDAPAEAVAKVPESGPDPAPALRLRPLDGEERPRVPAHLLAEPSALTVRPAEPEPQPRPRAVSHPDFEESDAGPESGPQPGRGGGEQAGRHGPDVAPEYPVLDPYRINERHSSAGPPPLWLLLPSLTARYLARNFRRIRDGLYVASLFFLVLVLIGYLFQWKVLLHLGAVGVVAANVGMFGAGVAYLLTLPFRESFRHGMANLLIPFYAIYYWTTRWPRMKTPVYRTLGAFLPMALVALAYAVYEEAPAVEAAIERELPALEKAVEEHLPGFDKKLAEVLEPLEKDADRAAASASASEAGRSSPGARRHSPQVPPSPPF